MNHTLAKLFRAALLAAGLVSLASGLTGCGTDTNMVDDRNPFYLKGARLRDEGKYEEAAQAFETCLRLTPKSVKAHLQLAMLCEERLNDPFQAVIHYRLYLRKATANTEDREAVEKWLARAERTCLVQLADRYPGDVEMLITRNQQDGPSSYNSREKYLLQRLQQANAEVRRLRELLAKSDPAAAVPAAGDAAGPLPPPESVTGTAFAAAPVVIPSPPRAAGAVTMVEPPIREDGPMMDPAADAPDARRPAPTGPAGVARSPGTVPGPATGPAVKPAPVAATASRPFTPLVRLSSGGGHAALTLPAAGTDVAVAPAAANLPGARTTYTVQSGDTLSSIARKFYGAAASWNLIREANPDALRGGNSVKPGMKLVIPPRPAAPRGAG